MSLSQTPSAINEQVEAFSKRINPKVAPIFLAIEPEDDAEPLDCFHNVRRKIARSGGSMVVGWAIWIWPRILIEAEHHAVYQSPLGRLIDVTPSQIVEHKRRLFLRDDGAHYNFTDEGVRRDNIRLPLTKDQLVLEFIAAAEAQNKILNAIPGIGAVKTDAKTMARLREFQLTQVALQVQIAMKYTRPNELCFCGSGQKFKHCHKGSNPFSGI